MLVLFPPGYFIDKVFPSLCGAGLGASIAVIGWLVSNHFANKQAIFKFRNDFLERTYWKISDALSEYQDWLAELHGQLQGFDRRNIEENGIPKMDYDEKATIIWRLILEDSRSDKWFHVFANHELIFPKYKEVFMELEKRQNLIQEFCLNLYRQIKARVANQYLFEATNIGFDRIRDQGRLIAELSANIQFDCLRPVIEGTPFEKTEDGARPTVSRGKNGKIFILE